MTRKLVTLTGAMALGLLLFMGGPTVAGDYHTGATLNCTECHIMHGQQSHTYEPDGTGFFTTPGTSAPYDYLLRNEINDLCLTCHNGSLFAPDVFEEPTPATGGTVRQAGGLNRLASGDVDYTELTGHTLDTTVTAPGGTWSNPGGLNCIDCHHPHGYGGPTGVNAYRNLNPFPGGGMRTPPSYNHENTTRNIARDVWERSHASYDITDVDFNEPNDNASAYGNWCGGCHSNFHGAPGSTQIGGHADPNTGIYEEFLRHPTAGVNIGALTGGHSSKRVFSGDNDNDPNTVSTKINWVKVMTDTATWTPTSQAEVTDHTPSCFSCHKAHGNKNAFGLIYMKRDSGAQTEEGTATGEYKDLCQQCHVQG